jgi:integrase
MLGTAVEWGRIPENPASRLRLPKADPGERGRAARRVVGLEDLQRLFAAAGSARVETFLRAAGEVGMRRGEIIGLRWPDVDLAARRIVIRRQVVQVHRKGGGHEKVVSPPKSGRESTVAISPALARRLADWYAESVVEGGAPAGGYVWPGTDGGPMHNRSLARALERACERAGLGEWEVVGGRRRFRALLSPHRLRHSAASVMLAEGVPLPVVSAQLTHASPRITAQIYSHMVGDDLDRAAAVFDRDPAEPRESHRAGDRAGSTPGAENPLQD